MGKSRVYHLYCHLVWATWDRMPLITSDLEPAVYNAILSKCEELGAQSLAIGGTEDHVHLLVRFPPIIAITKLVQEAKGVSSHLVTHTLKPGQFFKWQVGYGAFTVSERAVQQVSDYIRHQKEHHQQGKIDQSLE